MHYLTVHAAFFVSETTDWIFVQALSASAPLIALWDDHEFVNNVSRQLLYNVWCLASAQFYNLGASMREICTHGCIAESSHMLWQQSRCCSMQLAFFLSCS